MTPPESIADTSPNRFPSRSSMENPSRSMTGSPATVPLGSSDTTRRIESITSARDVCSDAGESKRQITATVR